MFKDRTMFWVLFTIIILWNWTASDSFTYFWIGFNVLTFGFLIYYRATWKKDVRRMVDRNKAQHKERE